MPRLKYKIPSYCRHKYSGQAIVTLNGKDHNLGPYGSPQSRRSYEDLIQSWLEDGKQLPYSEDDPSQRADSQA